MEQITNEEFNLILIAVFEKYVRLEQDSEEQKDDFMLSDAFHDQSRRYYRIWKKLAYNEIKIIKTPGR